MNREQQFLARMRSDPGADFRRVALEVGISGRCARRLIAGATSQTPGRWRPRARAVAIVLAVSALGALALWRQPAAHDETPPVPSSELSAAERDLYGALDRRDATLVSQANRDLQHDDEGVRLASLRYLATLGAQEHSEAVARTVDDSSARVRLAAIPLLSGFVAPAADDALLRVATDRDRPLAERTLALAALENRAPGRIDLARSLLPVLRDSSPHLRAQAARLITRFSGRTVADDLTDPSRLHAVWEAALEGGD